MGRRDRTDRGSPAAPRHAAMVVLAIVAVVVAGVGPRLLGYGWFGHRALLYGHNDLYVMNLTDAPRTVTVDGRTTRTIRPDNAAILPLVGGRSTVDISGEDGELLRRRTVESNRSHVLLDLGGETCFVVGEVSNLSEGDELEVDVADLLGPDVSVHPLGSRNVVWPRGYPGVLREDSTDPALSVEVVDCSLRDEPEFVENYLRERLAERL